MKKINLELGKISKGMRLRFSLILDSEQGPQNRNFNLVNHFQIDGNEYFRLNPHPFITIDISDSFGKNETWSSNHVVNLNQRPFVIGNKTCYMQYIVIKDDKDPETEYEGIIFMINSADNFCYLTIDELNYLYYLLRSINMTDLSLQVMNYYQSLKNDADRSVQDLTKQYSKPPLIEEPEEIPEPNQIPPIIEPNEIPDLY